MHIQVANSRDLGLGSNLLWNFSDFASSVSGHASSNDGSWVESPIGSAAPLILQ